MDHLDEITWKMLLRRTGTGAELARAMRHLEVCPDCLAQWRSRRLGVTAIDSAPGGPRWIDWEDLLARWQQEEAHAEESPLGEAQAVKARVG